LLYEVLSKKAKQKKENEKKSVAVNQTTGMKKPMRKKSTPRFGEKNSLFVCRTSGVLTGRWKCKNR